MAAVTRVKPLYVSPPGYEVIDTGTAVEAISAGMLCSLGASGWSKLAAGQLDPDGIALQDYAAGQVGCDFGIQGEMDGFSGLSAGSPVWPSSSVAGGMDTTAPTIALDGNAGTITAAQIPVVRIKATTTTRIRFNFV